MDRASTNSKSVRRTARPSASRPESSLSRTRKRPRLAKLSSSSFDWAKFTNFKSRYTRQDLEQLFRETKPNRRKELLERPDGVGLYPIHWAAINNRPDLIECLFSEGSSLSKKCHNSLFADGTPLHLAAMSSSLEAAATILIKGCELERHRTRPKIVPEVEKQQRDKDAPKDGNQQAEDNKLTLMSLLEARDADGQTPLMRAAAPRSRKWDTIRELLQKNFWSLSGRPAEMALFLICMGADWRNTEPINGMNLMHLAIMNDYDDIVSLLLVIDKQMADVATVKPNSRTEGISTEESNAVQRDMDGFQTIALRSSPKGRQDDERSTIGSEKSDLSPTRKPLIDSKRANAADLILRGIKPLQLATIYGRVKIISLLWRPISGRSKEREDERGGSVSNGEKELKRLLIRACFSDKNELAKFLKPLLLKVLLALDLVIIVLVWAPIYCSYHIEHDSSKEHPLEQQQNQDQHHHHHRYSVLPSFRGGLFIVSYCLTMALTLRVVLKNPGYLRRHSVHYLSELAKLLDGAPKARETIASRIGKTSAATSPITHTNESSKEAQRRPSSPLIKLDDTTSIVVGNSGSRDKQDTEEKQTGGGKKVTVLAMDKGRSAATACADDSFLMSEKQIRRVQHGVRQLCHRCQCIRRARSRHCTNCDHCVQDFDHHCIYLGCCIGRNNRLDFLLAMIALSITSIYGTVLQSVSMRHMGWSRFWHLVALFWIFKYVIIGTVSAFLNLRRACLGVTLYEEVRSDRLRHIFGRHGTPEAICKTHATLSTMEDSFWRYLPYDGRKGPQSEIMRNLREFANNISPDEYLLTFICTDTPLARSLLARPNEMRVKQQQMHKLF